MLDQLYKKSDVDLITPINVPKLCGEKWTDVKEYKRMYYLANIEIYKERNAAYRKLKKAEKHLQNNKNIIIV
jgi:hypothetical protein